MKSDLLLKRIEQKDNHTFTIHWSDDSIKDYPLNMLQKNCPCASCVDEMTGKRLVDADKIDPQVRATRLYNIGRYAIRVLFTSGCTHGIFSFDMLYRLGMNRS